MITTATAWMLIAYAGGMQSRSRVMVMNDFMTYSQRLAAIEELPPTTTWWGCGEFHCRVRSCQPVGKSGTIGNVGRQPEALTAR